MTRSLERQRRAKLKERVRELERILGRKTMENEILREALDAARVKKQISLPTWPDEDAGR